MLTSQEKSKITEKVNAIKMILEFVAANPKGCDILKTSCEIVNLFMEDREIVDNMKSYWSNLNAGSER